MGQWSLADQGFGCQRESRGDPAMVRVGVRPYAWNSAESNRSAIWRTLSSGFSGFAGPWPSRTPGHQTGTRAGQISRSILASKGSDANPTLPGPGSRFRHP
jgi:hypothetical protein